MPGSVTKLAEPSLDDLRALHVLLETCNVTASARSLGVSQPAMSRTLGRLRAAFGDPLLAPAGRGLEPTPRARELSPHVERALLALRAVLEPAAGGVPRPWSLAASDYGFFAVLRGFLAEERAREPGRAVAVAPLGLHTLGALARGEVDLALAPRVDVEGLDEFVLRPLFRDRYGVALRPGHPALGRRLTLERYLSLEHVVVQNSSPGPSAVQVTLARLGHRRRVPVRAPSFGAALELVATSDLVATLPARFLASYPRALAVREPPFEMGELVLNLVFSPRRVAEPEHRRLREGLLAYAAAMPGCVRAGTRPLEGPPQGGRRGGRRGG